MCFKNKPLFLIIIGLWMTLLLPNYVIAAFTFSAHDTKGAMLNFSNPALIAGTCPSGKTCVSNGDGATYAGAKYKYTNVITVDGIQVDAIVSVDAIVNATLNTFDDSTPNPTPAKAPDPDESWRDHTIVSGEHKDYLTTFGVVVPEGAIFAPQITSSDHTKDAHVDFTISFQDTSGNPVVLKNVYNNTLDVESVEYNEFGGFQSYAFASDYKTNTVQHMIATAGLAGKTRFSNSNCPGNAGLYITDSSRVQTKFDTITSLKLTNGQHANGTVPNGSGGVTSCTNSSIRYYGAIFVHDGFTDTGNPPVETTVPTVNMLTTSDTTPSVTGTIGGIVSTASPSGSALATGDTFSIVLNGVTYTVPNANLVINGVNWTLNVPTALPVQTYDVVATRNGVLVDQTTNELVITPLCTLPQVLNATGTACVTPASTDTVLCHSGDGLTYAKILIPSTGVTGHETHPFDVQAVNGLCPDDTVTCTAPQILNAAKTACITPVVNGTACIALTDPLTNIPSDSDYDGKKVTICHFPPGNPNNVQIISISVNAVSAHLSHHGDAIWQSGKSCPATSTSCDVVPTVNTATTTDKIPPALSGTVGTSSSLTISINSSPAVSGTAVISGNTWTYTPSSAIAAGTYNVTATGDTGLVDTTTNELTVTASVIPTVDTKTTTDKIAIPLTGTVGTSISLTIQVKDSTGAIKDSGTATIIGTTWTFLPIVLPAGTYNVVATGDAAHGNLVDTTIGELTVTASVIPTVNNTTTTDKIPPTLTGTVGTSTSLTITVNGISGAATINGTTWTYTPAAAIPAGTYNVTATGDSTHGSLTDTTTNELTVTASSVPTVNNTTTTDKIPPTLTGTVGSSASLTITVNGISGAATINGTTWTYTPAAAIPAGTYNVTATGDTAHGSLTDTTTNELTVTASTIPTVNTKTTTDQIAPVLTGTVGSSKSLTITIKSTPQVSGAATINGTTWTFTSPSKIAAGNYDVVALGETGLTDATTNELTVTTCTLPKVYNAAGDACIDPVPTVVTQTTDSNTPVITGTVGVVALGTTETFTVAVNGKTYDKSSVSSSLVVSGLNWTLTIPVANAIPAGIYDVDAVRNTVSKDATSKELTINLVCALPQILNTTRTACMTPVIPTVNTTTTTDKVAASLSGNVGSSASLTITVSGTSGAATINGSTWTYTAQLLPVGVYDVIATGDTGLTDATINELTVTMACTAPKVANAAGTACISPVPTVNILTTSSTTPTLTGTVGTTALTNGEVFTVGVNGVTYTQNSILISGTSWSLAIPTALPAGKTYDVDAIRSGTPDATSGELTITDNIDICDMSKTPHDQSIARSTFDGSKMGANYYLGKCNIPPCSNPVLPTDPAECTPPLPDPTKDPTDCTKTDAATLTAIANGTLVCVLPSQPGALVDEQITSPGSNVVNYCISGTIVTGEQTKSQASVTIKRARIANATTQGGKVCLYNTADCPTDQPPAQIKYGTLTASSNVDLTNATINKGVATNVNITGATLEGAFIDTPNDYVSPTGVVNNGGGNWITVLGGMTLKTPTGLASNDPNLAIVTSGVITAGQDTQGNPIRGNITNAIYNTDVTNAANILTKGRRTQGTIVNATITGARTTTVTGKTVVDFGTLVSGYIQSGTTPSTYGTVLNTAVTATTITQDASQCSAGGSITGVGSRGQLMWKEVVHKK